MLARKGKKERERRLERREREGERKGRERERGVEREREVTVPLDKGYTGRRGLNYGAACVCLCLIYGLSLSCHPLYPLLAAAAAESLERPFVPRVA